MAECLFCVRCLENMSSVFIELVAFIETLSANFSNVDLGLNLKSPSISYDLSLGLKFIIFS